MSKATERRLVPSLPAQALMVVAADHEEADRRLADLVAVGESVGYAPLIILTGVPRVPGGLYA